MFLNITKLERFFFKTGHTWDFAQKIEISALCIIHSSIVTVEKFHSESVKFQLIFHPNERLKGIF